MTVRFRGRLFIALAALVLGCGSAAADDEVAGRVGVATAVNTMAQGQLPQQPPRPLVVGVDVALGERIDTDASGRAQLLFLDGSSITIGNQASVVVDDFVFDPTNRKGHLGLAMGRGLMRFIGGHLSKDGSVNVRTPTALLGIRGAIVLIEVAADGASTTATLLFGDKVTITGTSGAVEVIRRLGQSSTIRRDGVPTAPRRVGPEQIKPFDQALEARAPVLTPQPAAIAAGTVASSGPAMTEAGAGAGQADHSAGLMLQTGTAGSGSVLFIPAGGATTGTVTVQGTAPTGPDNTAAAVGSIAPNMVTTQYGAAGATSAAPAMPGPLLIQSGTISGLGTGPGPVGAGAANGGAAMAVSMGGAGPSGFSGMTIGPAPMAPAPMAPALMPAAAAEFRPLPAMAMPVLPPAGVTVLSAGAGPGPLFGLSSKILPPPVLLSRPANP